MTEPEHKAFACRMCGDCCYGEGGILLTAEDCTRVSRFLQMPEQAFLEHYCEKRNGQIYIRTGPDHFCIFFSKTEQCLIHPVKPPPCTLWPFYSANLRDRQTWKMAMDACPGLNQECTFEEFVKQSQPDPGPEGRGDPIP